jgi:hypothetical protein
MLLMPGSALIPGWVGPIQETQGAAFSRSVVVPPSAVGTPIVWVPGGGSLSLGLSPAL